MLYIIITTYLIIFLCFIEQIHIKISNVYFYLLIYYNVLS